MRSASQVKKFTLLILSLTFSLPALAHVKWFITEEQSNAVAFVPYSLTEPAVLVWILLACCMVGFSVFLDAKLPNPPLIDSKARQFIIGLLRIFTGLSFILTSYGGCLIAPHYVAYGWFGFVFLLLQLAIGVMLIANWRVFHAGALMLILMLGAKVQFGILETVEYWNVVGIALFLMLIHPPKGYNRVKLMSYSVPALRIMTGIALITLGFSEKLLGANYGHAFITTYDWNFMTLIGMTFFDDRLFVLSAGVMEVVFGSILILGTVTRLNILVVAIFMITTNVTFVFQDNMEAAIMELVGHLPIIATAVICVFFGSGQKLKFTSLMKKTAKTKTTSGQRKVMIRQPTQADRTLVGKSA